MKLAICSLGGPVWVETACRLAALNDLEVNLFTSHGKYAGYSNRIQVTERLPGCRFVDRNALARSLATSSAPADWYAKLSQAQRARLAREYLTLIRIADRYVAPARPAHLLDSEMLVRRHLGFAHEVLVENEIDGLVFADTPHLLLEYSLHVVASSMGLPRIYLYQAWNSSHFFAVRELHAVPTVAVAEHCASSEHANTAASLRQSWERNQSAYSVALPTGERSRPSYLPGGERPDIRRRARQAMVRVKKIAQGRALSRVEASTMLSVVDRSKAPTLLELILRQTASRRRIRQLQKSYDAIASDQLPSNPFAAYFLHFQPEATTLPRAGDFVDQFAAIFAAADALPGNWSLVVREHPRSFQRNWNGFLSRSRYLYEGIRAHPKVRLLSINCDPFAIIDRSECVITATGTVGWEALCRGRQVLATGNPWYGSLPGVFMVHDYEGFRRAFEAIETQAALSSGDVFGQAQRLGASAYQGVRRYPAGGYGSIDAEVEGEKLARVVAAEVGRLC